MLQTHREESMPRTRENAAVPAKPRRDELAFIFAFIVAFLVVFGGFVRLTRSGLSITEWNPDQRNGPAHR